MKKITFVILFLTMTGAAVLAQQKKKTTYPYWTSKEIVKFQHRNDVYSPSKLVVGDPANTISKGVAQFNARKHPVATRKISTPGYPVWTVSKGVARWNLERSQARKDDGRN